MKNQKLIIKFRMMVISHSVASTWSEARAEWRREGKKQRMATKCLCGRNILNVFFVKNWKKGVRVPMGRGCANKLVRIDPAPAAVTAQAGAKKPTGSVLVVDIGR